MYHVLFHVITTNEVPVTILQAYIFLSRHIRKDVLIRRQIYVTTQQLVANNFAKNRVNVKTELMSESYDSFFHHCVLSCN